MGESREILLDLNWGDDTPGSLFWAQAYGPLFVEPLEGACRFPLAGDHVGILSDPAYLPLYVRAIEGSCP